MKILRLRLMAFGPFENAELDLGGGEEGLHLVYGPNEAGKSTALRALRQLLYGIPERSPDSYRHSYTRMRIGGILRHPDGTVLEFIRRKGKVKTIRAKDDKEWIEESELKRFLGDIDASLFATMFGIGHSDLVRGGEEIVRGGGNVGQALFAAGSGIVRLQGIQKDLQAEADALFTPSASRRPINEAISELKRLQREMREAELPWQEWEGHVQALQDLLGQKSEVDALLDERRRERNRTERFREALPLIARRKELLRAMEAYADAVLLPRDFRDRRMELLTRLKIEEKRKEEALNALGEIERTSVQIEIPEDLLQCHTLIEALYQDLGGYVKAARDRIQLMTKRDLLRAEAMEVLARLRKDWPLDRAEELRLTRAEVMRIQELGSRYERLLTQGEEGQKSITRLSRHLEDLEAQRDALEVPDGIEELRAALERAMGCAGLDEQCRKQEADLAHTRRVLETGLQRQSLWKGSLEDLETLALPPPEAVDVFEARFAEAESAVASLRREAREVEENRLRTQGELAALVRTQEVPLEKDLLEARRLRDRGWGLVRKAWEGGRIPEDDAERFVRGFQPAASLAEAFEESVRRADEVADRLRREADRVAAKARLLAEREVQESRQGEIRVHVASAEARLQGIVSDWERLWEPAGVTARSPKEMRAWLQVVNTLGERFAECREKKAGADDLRARVNGLVRELRSSFSVPGEKGGEEREPLTLLITRARKAIQHAEKIRARKEQLLGEIRERAKDLRDVRYQVREVENGFSRWREEWERAIRPLGSDRDLLPAQAIGMLDDIRSLFEKIREADVLHKRVRGIERDAEEFNRRVFALAERAAADLGGASAEQVTSELMARLTRARALKTRREALGARQEEEAEKLEGSDRAIGEVHALLSLMCREAGCATFEGLPEAEDRSDRRQRMEIELEGLERELRRLSGGEAVQDFIEEACVVNPDDMEGRLEKLRLEIEALGESRSSLDQRIGTKKSELARMDGTSRAADLAEEAERTLARIEADVEKYARLRLASALLARAVERYRMKHQGPILRAANDLFARLTLGSFEGVRAEFDEQGTPILMGVRGGSRDHVGVGGMSEGTTDQLYLALRLASLEAYLERNEAMPFVVDDILIRFDDERARAALEALGELSKKTQVILFTHHPHVVELAERALEPHILFKHVLGA